MGLMDIFRPKWRHSDPAVRLKAVNLMTMPKDTSTLLLVLAEDTSEKVRLAAEEMLAKTAASLAEGVFSVADGDLVIKPREQPGDPIGLYDGQERQGKMLVLDNKALVSCLAAVSKIDIKRAQPAITYLRQVVAELDKVHSETSKWRMYVVQVDKQGRMYLSTVSTRGPRETEVYVFDLKKVRQTITDTIESLTH